jgi:hypothetical protein
VPEQRSAAGRGQGRVGTRCVWGRFSCTFNGIDKQEILAKTQVRMLAKTAVIGAEGGAGVGGEGGGGEGGDGL